MKSPDETKFLKTLAIVGVAALVFAFVTVFFVSYVALRTARTTTFQPTASGNGATNGAAGLLGELGSACGGPQRLPCKPGLACSATGGASGTCVKDVSQPSLNFQQYGEACGTNLPPCSAGLFCRKPNAGQAWICDKLTDQAPYIVSIQPEGAQTDAGWYRAAAGSTVHVLVQAVNATHAVLSLIPKGTQTVQILGDMKPEGGGRYSLDLTIPANLQADLMATVNDGQGQTAALTINLAALPAGQ